MVQKLPMTYTISYFITSLLTAPRPLAYCWLKITIRLTVQKTRCDKNIFFCIKIIRTETKKVFGHIYIIEVVYGRVEKKVPTSNDMITLKLEKLNQRKIRIFKKHVKINLKVWPRRGSKSPSSANNTLRSFLFYLSSI